MLISEKLNRLRIEKDLTQEQLAKIAGVSYKTISCWELGTRNPKVQAMQRICAYFGYDLNTFIDETSDDYMPTTAKNTLLIFPSPTVTTPEQTVTFHPIGTVAAGYDSFAFEELEEDSIEVPESYLHGRPKSDYFLLRVTGDSMYPMYHEGDHVLVLRQDYLTRSGEIGVVLYEGDKATLKKVEYADGEQWARLVPINPTYKELVVEGADLDNYRILGVPRVLIREL